MLDFPQLPFLLILMSHLVFADEPLIVAHRGASKAAPENTLAAFNLAWERGADAIEGDFHLTRDGHIVCVHDANTKHVAGKSLVVKHSSLKQLRALDVGVRHRGEYEGSVIPTLAEVLDTVPARKKVYIEIKSDASLVPLLCKVVEKSGLKDDQIVVISFHEDVIQKIKAKAPQYKALWLESFKRSKSGKVTPSIQTILETLGRIKADGLSSSTTGLTEDIVKSVKERGYEYHVWTIDDPVSAERFKKWGVQSITTNVPGKIRKHLETSRNK
jgi:glycerophosphoryl diester phosphodiesterase